MTESFKPVAAWQIREGDVIGYKVRGTTRHLDTIEKGTVIEAIPSKDSHKKPITLWVRLENGVIRRREFRISKQIRYYP